MSPITDEELAWARECMAAGDTVKEIARADGRPVDVWECALRPGESLSPDTLTRARALLSAGKSLRETAAAVGISPNLLDRLLWQGLGRAKNAARVA